jgi:alpha-mannosidase
MTRREFARFLSSGIAIATADVAILEADSSTPTLYFVDGYHGGAKGHMPAGAWRDILNTMRAIPSWKLGLDIEPESWDALLRDDPGAYHELKSYLESTAQAPRVEMLGGTFSQPYGWAVNGESNIRQLTRGMEIIRRHFPRTLLETYAVQEPCWASCLPQILRSLGFTAAVLKDPGTAWGGYSAGFDAELVNWVGSDGTSISTVPRYACEDLKKVYETESGNPTPEFARKCVEHGIRHPAGTYLQDLGWAAKPKVAADFIRNVTWREYFHQIADPPSKEWKFVIEDILTTLPWGEKTLQLVAQQERSAENRILIAEKMAAIAWMEKRSAWPAAEFTAAWDNLLWAQGHDPWITATTRTGRQAWAFQVAAGTMQTEETATSIIDEASRVLAEEISVSPSQNAGAQWVRVVNTLGADRDELAEISFATDRGTRSIRVLDAQGHEIPCQITPTRRYSSGESRQNFNRRDGAVRALAPGESLNAASILFRARVPAIGSSLYRLEPVDKDAAEAAAGSTGARVDADGSVVLENDLYRLHIDPPRGGAITSLLAKKFGKEFCEASGERVLNEYRGYFIAQKQWHSSTERPANVAILENGPLRARVRISGQVGGVPFQTMVTLAEGGRRIDFQVRFNYQQETWIGDPWDIKPEDRRSERRRSQNDGRWKLQAFFPVSLRNQAIYKNAAYDVCKSRNADTFFQGWDEIKHNIIVNWVDLFDDREKTGLAILSDHTTAYTHGPEHPLALVLGWGWEGGFWWGKRPLEGTTQIGYSLVPHQGLWDEGGLWEETSRWHEPLIPFLLDGAPPVNSEAGSLIRLDTHGVEVATIQVEGDRALVRLFNAAGPDSEFAISFAMRPSRVELVELSGKPIRELPVRRGPDGRYAVRLAMPRFGIRTLRCELDRMRDG